MRHSYNSGPCRFCGKWMSCAGFAVAAHEKKDIRQGLAVEVWRWSWKGDPIDNTRRVVKNAQASLDQMAKQDLFPTFEACKKFYDSRPVRVDKKPDNRRFQSGRGGRSGGGVYVCKVCHKRTRETGEEESSLGMCAFCLAESYLENGVNDGVITEAEFDTQLAELRVKYGRKA